MIIAWFALCTVSFGAAPTKAPATFEAAAGGDVTGLRVSDDGDVITGITSDGEVLLIDGRSWTSGESNTNEVETSPVNCTSTSAIAVAQSTGYYVYIGCEQGDVLTWRWNNGRLRCHGGDDANECLFLELSQDKVVSLTTGPDGAIYALTEAGGGNLTPHELLAAEDGSLLISNTYTPSGAFRSGFREAVPNYDAGGVPIGMAVWHGSGDFSSWTLASGSVVPTNNLALQVSPVDIATGPGTLGAYMVERNQGRLTLYSGNPQQPFTVLRSDLGSPNAVVRMFRDDTSWVVVQRGSRVQVFPDEASEAEQDFSVDFTATDMVEGPKGYVLAGTDGGTIEVLTANPWVSDVQVIPTTVGTGGSIDVSFVVDEPGNWAIYGGGDRSGSGERLAQGTADGGGVVAASVQIPTTLGEGEVEIWVVHTANGTALRGYSRATIVVDNAPTSVGSFSLGIGDNQLQATFRRVGAEDLVGYDVYISDAPFTSADYPSGGPDGKVAGVQSPVRVDQPEAILGNTVSVWLRPLANGTEYWVAVRAIDANAEGPMSEVLSARPARTVTGCSLKDDCAPRYCGTTPGAAGWLLALAGAALLGARRRREGVMALLLVGGLLPGAARAQSAVNPFEEDMTPAWANFEFHAGAYSPADAQLKQLYGEFQPAFHLEAGVQLWRYGEIDLGIGIVDKVGKAAVAVPDANGNVVLANEDVKLNLLPLSLSATLRVHVMDEQPFVPYATIGMDYMFWFESALDEFGAARGDKSNSGGKFGWHWGAGGNILLDLLAPRRAAKLEATTGINDTWLVVEYKQLFINPGGPGLDFSGWSISGGLKLDY